MPRSERSGRHGRHGGLSSRRLPAVLLGVPLLIMALAGPGATAEPGADGDVGAARLAFDQASTAWVQAQAMVDALYAEHRGVEAEVAQLGGDQRTVAQRVHDAQSRVRRYVVDAYITGTTPEMEQSLLYEETGPALAYKTYFLRDRNDQVRTAMAERSAVSGQLDARTAELTATRTRVAAELNAANVELDRSIQAFRAADTRLRRAEHAAERARADAATKAAQTTTTRPAPQGGGNGASGNAQGPGWDKLRQCEAGGNYGAISPGGQYRGAYQFDLRTWQGLGGSGDPATAPPAEQDRLAQQLFNQRGAQPWPVCGRYLV